jgi:hypothetical protein
MIVDEQELSLRSGVRTSPREDLVMDSAGRKQATIEGIGIRRLLLKADVYMSAVVDSKKVYARFPAAESTEYERSLPEI